MARRIKQSSLSRYQPLQFSRHADEYAPTALAHTPGFPRLFPKPVTERWRRQMGRYTNQPKGPLAYPVPNGVNDPLSIACVLDLVLRLEVGPYMSGGNLAFELNRSYEQVIWDAVTVGKILSDVVSFADLLEMPSPHHQRPLYLRKHGGIRNYIVHDDPHGWQWIGLIREYMGRKAEEYIRERRQDRPDSVWEPVMGFKYGQKVGESA